MSTRVCPFCGSDKLVATLKEIVIVSFNDETNDYDIINKSSQREIEIGGCFNCHNEFTENDLIAGKECSECHEIVSEEDLVDGLCPACRALKEKNLSPNELIRLLLKEKQECSCTAEKMKKKQEAGEAKEEPVEEEKAEQPAETEAKPKKRSVKRKKKADTEAEETPSEAQEQPVVKEEAVTEAQEQIDTVNVPFPEVPAEMTDLAEEIMNDKDDSSSFSMFDDDPTDPEEGSGDDEGDPQAF